MTEMRSIFPRKCYPIFSNKRYNAASAFTPESLLREARRQKRLSSVAVPDICILDPDGDLVRQVRAAGGAQRHTGWACLGRRTVGGSCVVSVARTGHARSP
jgi:hypothetical protein